MSNKIPTPHINAKEFDFAPIVLMPGDPLRAKFIAEKYLSNVQEVTNVRGMLGYTGYYKDKKISVMGHGMGIPSIGIYSYELFNFYHVEKIIRIGSCGSFLHQLNLGDIIIADQAVSYSTYATCLGIDVKYNTLYANEHMVEVAKSTADDLEIPVFTGTVLSSDVFYGSITNGILIDQMLKQNIILAVEMEAFALYANAIKLNKQALTILTVSDSIVKHEEMSSEQRQLGFGKMVELALETALKLME